MEGPFLLAFAASKAVWRGTPQAMRELFRIFEVLERGPSFSV
jgi:hypothetical protein